MGLAKGGIGINDRGIVTIRIAGPNVPGEALFDTVGGTQKVRAYAMEEIPANAGVIVYDIRPGGVSVVKE